MSGSIETAPSTVTDQTTLEDYWTTSVYDASLATVCAANADTPPKSICQVTVATGEDPVFECVDDTVCTAALDYNPMLGATAVTDGTLCFVATPAYEVATTTDTTDTTATTGDEAAGETCTAWITETPETGCADDDVPADDAPDADFDKYIRDCKVDYTKGNAEMARVAPWSFLLLMDPCHNPAKNAKPHTAWLI